MLWINAGAPEKEQFLHAEIVGGFDDVVLNREVLEQKFNRGVAIRLDSADFRGR